MITLNIDGNNFEYHNALKLNGIAYEGESDFLDILSKATKDNDFDKSIFYESYDIVNLDNLNNVIHKFNIFEMNRGSCFVKSFWGCSNVKDIKNCLMTGNDDLNINKSLNDFLYYYIDRNYRLFTKIELRDFIINRQDINNLFHSSVVHFINKL